MKLCFVGGSFEPIREEHLHLASEAVRECGLDEVLFLPCAQSPLKSRGPHASDEERCAMINLALENFEQGKLDETDLLMPPPSWSWRVAEAVKQARPDDELFWLIGSDQWVDMEKWARWDYLSSLVTFIVYKREIELKPKDGIRAIFLDGNHNASSTDIRESLESADDVLHLPESVEEFIREKGLYRSQQTAE